MKLKLKWERNAATGEWESSDGWGGLVIQHSRKTKRWYLLRTRFMQLPTVLSHHTSRSEAQQAAEGAAPAK